MSDQVKIGDIVTKPVLDMMPKVFKFHWHCATCDVPILGGLNYCPVCGARKPETV